MTNVLAPYSEAKSIYNGYKQSGILETSINFIIPVYNNMPEIPTESPNINQTNYRRDNSKVYCNATNVNIRTGPGTSYEIITTVDINEEMTRIKKSVQSGNWDKVKLQNGIIGYIYNSYLTEVKQTEPENNNSITFNSSLKVNGSEITGIDYTQNTVEYIKNLITTNYEIQIINNKNQELKNTDLIGTGTRIIFKNNGQQIAEYSVILYGDVNGDGKINSIDLLVLQRHILQISGIGEIYKKAANINKTASGPSSVDLLIIQRHILEIKKIIQ